MPTDKASRDPLMQRMYARTRSFVLYFYLFLLTTTPLSLAPHRPLVSVFFPVDFSSKVMQEATSFHYRKALEAAKRFESKV